MKGAKLKDIFKEFMEKGTTVKPIQFQGVNYLYVGLSSLKEGAISTVEQYESGDASFAFLLGGEVLRQGEVIGTAEDITWRADEAN